jgi:hypothetical protein
MLHRLLYATRHYFELTCSEVATDVAAYVYQVLAAQHIAAAAAATVVHLLQVLPKLSLLIELIPGRQQYLNIHFHAIGLRLSLQERDNNAVGKQPLFSESLLDHIARLDRPHTAAANGAYVPHSLPPEPAAAPGGSSQRTGTLQLDLIASSPMKT